MLESADWQSFRPRVIVVESIKPVSHEPAWHNWEQLLLDADYCFALFDGLNRYYYRSEEPDLSATLSIPANVLDGYIAASVKTLRDRVLELELARKEEEARKSRSLKHRAARAISRVVNKVRGGAIAHAREPNSTSDS